MISRLTKMEHSWVFTSHDLSTMNNNVFCRDEIWFVAKGKEQNAKLYSLLEFRNTKGESGIVILCDMEQRMY